MSASNQTLLQRLRRADWRFFTGMTLLSPIAGMPWLLTGSIIPVVIQIAFIIVFAFVIALKMNDD